MVIHKSLDIVDFHSHILPGADHGSGSLETSIWQINSAIRHGVTRIIATPHFYPHRHRVDDFVHKRDEAFYKLEKHIPKGVKIVLGAEVLICQGIENLPDIDKLFISGTNCLLLEIPSSDFQNSYYESVSELIKRGVDVIIAHPDRYPKMVVENMIKLGAGLQLNASSITGIAKRGCAMNWLALGAVVALGSDIHNEDRKAYKNFSKALKRMGKNAEYVKKRSDKIWKRAKKKK